MKINIVVTTCGEQETKYLLNFLVEKTEGHIEYNVICMKDSTKDPSVYEGIDGMDDVQYFESPMDGDFSKFRNSVHTIIGSGEYVFFIDADETVSETMIKYLPHVLKVNDTVDLFFLPRNNYVDGITDEYVKKMRWNLDEEGRINYPDWQGRIYKYQEGIKWKRKVHEVLSGMDEYTRLGEEWAHLEHKKTFNRQKKQNELYEKLD